MSQQLTLAIIDADRVSCDVLVELLRPYSEHLEVCCATTSFEKGLQNIQAAQPKVLLLGVSDLGQGVEQVHSILTHCPRTSVFVVCNEKNPDWILRLMRAGAVEYILKPVEKTDLFEALQKAGKMWITNTQAEIRKQGKVYSVYNPIGGMGTTTIAVNLAAALRTNDVKVALVDLNLFSGDVSVFLDVAPRYTLSSITSNLSRLDASFLMSVMTQHSSGVYLLGEPLEVEETIGITPEQVQKMIDFLKGVFDFVVIDTGGLLFGTNEAAFRSSDVVLYNTVLNLPALKNAKRYMAAMEKRGIKRDSIRIVVNRYLSKADIKERDAEKVLDRSVLLTIPNEYSDVNDSINKGVPVVNLYPRSLVSKAVVKLAELLKEQKK